MRKTDAGRPHTARAAVASSPVVPQLRAPLPLPPSRALPSRHQRRAKRSWRLGDRPRGGARAHSRSRVALGALSHRRRAVHPGGGPAGYRAARVRDAREQDSVDWRTAAPGGRHPADGGRVSATHDLPVEARGGVPKAEGADRRRRKDDPRGAGEPVSHRKRLRAPHPERQERPLILSRSNSRSRPAGPTSSDFQRFDSRGMRGWSGPPRPAGCGHTRR